jgi:hypothetical protein
MKMTPIPEDKNIFDAKGLVILIQLENVGGL